MQEGEKERSPVKSSRQFDESKLTPPQRRALEFAKAQGAPFNRRLEDLIQDIEAEAVDEINEIIMSLRLEGRKSNSRNPLDE